RTSQKHRTKYVDGDVEYVIDSYPDIPPLLEIEAPSEDQVFRAFDELGYGREETVPWDAQQVREHYS
ncbi:MAG: hypothetical protein SVU32_06760, partial [Candidatus Nanohaloarchaea archaeon]|nr:hypothetical protein [Candidatus Nanohaloarchaea archaeon]